MFLLSRLSARTPELITTLIIFSLSSGVLGGILIYMDSASPDVLDDMTSKIPIDMQVSFTSPFYMQNWTDPYSITMEDIEESVSAQEFVLSTSRVVFAEVNDWEEDYIYSRKGFLGADSSAFQNFPDAIDVDIDALSYDDNSCILERSLFLRIGAEIGGNFTLTMTIFNSTWQPVQIHREFIVVGTFVSNIYMHQPMWRQPEVTYLQMITTPAAIKTTFSMLELSQYYGIQDKIWVEFDHDMIIHSETGSIVDSLSNIKRRIENQFLPFVAVNYNEFQLINAVNEFSVWTISIRSIALAFSLPSVIMGVMLIQYNTRLLADSQRRDVGTLKTRGSSGFQAFSWVLSNAILTGFLGSIGAVCTGVLAALLSSTVKELLVFDLERLVGFTILLQPAVIVTVFSFSFMVGIIVALPAAIRALLMTASEAHSSLETVILSDSEKMGTPTADLLMIGIAGWLFAPMLSLFAYAGMSAFGSIAIALAIIPILAVFLFGFTRLLSRPTSAVKARILAKARRPSLAVGFKLMSRTVMMFKKSETMGTMFIAMVFTAGLFSSISATTGNVHMKQVFMFQTGADIVIDIDPVLTNVTLDLLQNISSIDGVSHVSPMLRTTAYVQYWDSQYYGYRSYYNQTITVFGVDPHTWIESAFWLYYFSFYSPPSISIPKLSESITDGINIITSFKPIDHYTVDSTGYNYYPVYSNTIDLQIITPESRNVTSCTIVDILAATVSNYPSVTYLPGEPDASSFVIVDINFLHTSYNTSQVTKFYVDIESDAAYEEVINDIYEIAPYTFKNIESPFTDIDGVLASRGTQSINGAYTLNVIFSIIYLTIGVAIVSLVRVRGLRKQISVIRALGAPNVSIVIASLSEMSIGLLLAMGIGSMIGITLAILLMAMPLLYMGISTSSLWSRLPVLLQIPFQLIGMIIVISVSVALIATYLTLRRTLKLNIAEEIQYNE